MVPSLDAFFLKPPFWERAGATSFALRMLAGVHTAGNRPSRAAPTRARRGTREARVRHVVVHAALCVEGG